MISLDGIILNQGKISTFNVNQNIIDLLNWFAKLNSCIISHRQPNSW